MEYAYYSKINVFKYLPKNFIKLFWLIGNVIAGKRCTWKRLLINVGIDELEFLNKTIKVAKFIGKYKVHSSIGTIDENGQKEEANRIN